MSKATLIHSDPAGEPVRRSSSDKNMRLDFKGNFHRVIEVTSAVSARENARRGK